MSLLARLECEEQEVFCVIPIDAQHRAICVQEVTRGILNSSLAYGAAAIIVAHNHPSGDVTPSNDDKMITSQLVSAGRVLDLPVYDHVIIGRGRYTSFAEAGLL